MSELRVVFTETPENPWMNLAWEEAFFRVGVTISQMMF